MIQTRHTALTFKILFLTIIFFTTGFFQPISTKIKVIPGTI